MTEVDESIHDVMCTHEVCCLAVKSDQQGTELVNPSKRALTGKAQLVDIRFEETFGAAFGLFAGAFVCHDVRNDFMVEACPACGFGVKGRVSVEIAPNDRNAQPFDELES